MGETAWLFAASSGANAIGTAAQTYSQSQAIKAQGRFQKNQLEFNASVAELQAEDAITRGNKEALNKRKQSKQVIGSQRAALAAQGIEVNADTASQIQEDTAGLAAEDIITIKNNAWREAWGYRVQAQDLRTQAAMAKSAARFNQTQTILTGGLQFARDVSGGVKDYHSYKNATK